MSAAEPSSDAAYGAKLARLDAGLAQLGSVAVAFSGGVDSSALLHAARRVLGERAIGVLADSASLPRRELREAREVAAAMGARLVEQATDEQQDADYQANAGQRCYFCKAALFRAMERVCAEHDIPWMAFGEVTDDWSDDRPGARAAADFGVVAPLSAAGFAKEDVRRYAREAGLRVADKPASACLASRIPVGTVVTPERLAAVESAEDALLEMGLRQIRVRHHGRRARVEVGASELAFAQTLQPAMAAALVRCGFLDFELHAYRAPGSGPPNPS